MFGLGDCIGRFISSEKLYNICSYWVVDVIMVGVVAHTFYLFFTGYLTELKPIFIFILAPLGIYQIIYGIRFVGVIRAINMNIESHMRNSMGIWIHNMVILGLGIGNLFSIIFLIIKKNFFY